MGPCQKIPTKFFFLTLDIPPPALYKEDTDETSVPNCHLFEVLQKFNGKIVVEGRRERRLYRIKKFPKYLIVHYKRFTKNEFFREKNPTIVNFPMNNLDLKDCKILKSCQIILKTILGSMTRSYHSNITFW